MNISGILLHGSIRNVNLVCKDHYFPVSRVDFVGVVIGRLNRLSKVPSYFFEDLQSQ